MTEANTENRKNKIVGSEVEKDVIEWLGAGYYPRKISRLLKKEKRFNVSFKVVKQYKEQFFDKHMITTKVAKKLSETEINDLGIIISDQLSQKYIALIQKRQALGEEIRARITEIQEKEKKEKDAYEANIKIWEANKEALEQEALEEAEGDEPKRVVVPHKPQPPDINTSVEFALNSYYKSLHEINKYVEQFTVKYELSKIFENIALEVIKISFDTLIPNIPVDKRESALVDFKLKVTGRIQDLIQKVISQGEKKDGTD